MFSWNRAGPRCDKDHIESKELIHTRIQLLVLDVAGTKFRSLLGWVDTLVGTFGLGQLCFTHSAAFGLYTMCFGITAVAGLFDRLNTRALFLATRSFALGSSGWRVVDGVGQR